MAKVEVKDLVRVKPKHPKQTLHLTLPVPPSNNAIYYNVRGGGRRLTARAQNYIRDSRASINDQLVRTKWVKPGIGEWMYLDLAFYFPDKRIRDSHNCLKILMDVLETIVYDNDYNVMPRIQFVEYDKENPRVEMYFTYQTTEREKLHAVN